jgi:rhodanese-related sulfurtransferase
MPRSIGRAAVQQLLQQGAQLVEVLPEEEYRQGHLPGALNIPLKTLTRETTAQLRRDRPVVVYCHDTQ